MDIQAKSHVSQEDIQAIEVDTQGATGPAEGASAVVTEEQIQELAPKATSFEANANEQTVTQEAPTPSKAGGEYWEQIKGALSDGLSRDDISSYMSQSLGIDKDEADKQIIDALANNVKMAKEDGLSDEDIKNYLIENKYDGEVVDSAMRLLDEQQVRPSWKDYEFDPQTAPENAQDISDLYKSVYGKYSTGAKQLGGMFSPEMAREARREIDELNLSIVDKLKDNQMDAFIGPEGELMMRDENGVEQVVDSSILNDFWNSKAEITGAISGAIAGAKAGAKSPGRSKLFTVPGGALLGSMGGASVGKAADMTVNAFILKEKLEADLYRTQMKEAAIFDGVMGITGGVLFKAGAGSVKGIMKAYNFALRGNHAGAKKALLRNELLDEEQAADILANWEKLTGKTAPGKTPEEKLIGVVSTTQQGAEAMVHHVASKDPKVANQLVKDIDERAKGINKLVDEVSDSNIGALVKEQLGNYRKDVGDFYGEVKDIAARNIDGTDFRFDIDKLAIDPVLDNIQKNISNPMRKEQFLLFSERIARSSEDRTFSGLVSMREAVNEFKHTRNNLKKPDVDALNKVLNKIDGQIGKAVKEYMPENGNEWLQQFGKAKTQYAKMKQLEKNVLYRTITRNGISEEAIQKGMSKYINSLDSTFLDVMEKLPAKTRAKAEGAVVKHYIERFTLGNVTDKQALHFPMISETLKGINIQTPEAKHLLTSIDRMAEVFKNDVNLSKVSGNLAVPKFQSYLTTDPVVRLKFEIASGMFNMIKTKIPGKQTNNMALLNRLEAVLDNPMNANVSDRFIASVPKESKEEVTQLVKQLRVEMTKKPNPQQDFKNMYKQSKTGTFAVSNGQLGKGIYLQNSIKNPNPSSKVIKREVNMSRMATIEDIVELTGKEVDIKDIRNLPDLQKQLEERGFQGIALDDKAMLFPEGK